MKTYTAAEIELLEKHEELQKKLAMEKKLAKVWGNVLKNKDTLPTPTKGIKTGICYC